MTRRRRGASGQEWGGGEDLRAPGGSGDAPTPNRGQEPERGRDGKTAVLCRRGAVRGAVPAPGDGNVLAAAESRGVPGRGSLPQTPPRPPVTPRATPCAAGRAEQQKPSGFQTQGFFFPKKTPNPTCCTAQGGPGGRRTAHELPPPPALVPSTEAPPPPRCPVPLPAASLLPPLCGNAGTSMCIIK